jgi:hypothetical protein
MVTERGEEMRGRVLAWIGVGSRENVGLAWDQADALIDEVRLALGFETRHAYLATLSREGRRFLQRFAALLPIETQGLQV